MVAHVGLLIPNMRHLFYIIQVSQVLNLLGYKVLRFTIRGTPLSFI